MVGWVPFLEAKLFLIENIWIKYLYKPLYITRSSILEKQGSTEIGL